jgi:glycerophosphoryl diester phosphodiesterase
MSGLDWLIARPIAHRGLHDASAGVIENTASAFSAAIAGNYGIECDLQISADGEAMVHHDDALGRLTEGSGRLAEMSALAIGAVRFKASADRILTLRELCTLVAGRVALVLELKSRFDGDLRLARRAADVLGSYAGPVAVMSFDPMLIEAMRTISPGVTRGIVAERYYAEHEWDAMPKREKYRMVFMLHFSRTRPQFVAYSLTDLPAAPPLLMRLLLGVPLLTWTVRSQDERRRAIRWANQIIFEGIRP